MFDRAGFTDYFLNVVGGTKGSSNTYRSFLKRVDEAIGGLDEALQEHGSDYVVQWAGQTDEASLAKKRSDVQSILKCYFLYRAEKASGAFESDTTISDEWTEMASELAETMAADANFLREREMQTQVRMQLGAIEPGLVAIDGGSEVGVATGRIDILARDTEGRTVVIELKPGTCPSGALEQLLAYAHDIEQEQGKAPRAMLVAGGFSERLRAAARRAGGVELVTYAYSLSFASVA